MNSKTKSVNFYPIAERIIVQFLIVIACWLLLTNWWGEDKDCCTFILSIFWSGNIFFLKSYSKWFRKIHKNKYDSINIKESNYDY